MTNGATNISAGAAGTMTIGGDLVVNRMGYGAMRIPGPGVWGEPRDPEAVRAVLRRCIDLGINLIDTSDYYGRGVANQWIARVLYPYPDDLVIVTKFGAKRGEDGSWGPDSRPEALHRACDDNLRNLRLERLDLVHFRYSDPAVPLAESLGAMADLQRQGKIRHIGVSNIDAAQLGEAQALIHVASVQNHYNLIDRRNEDVLNMCSQNDIPFMPYFPLAIGRLGNAGGTVARIAHRLKATPAQVALAWLLARSPVMVPIPGTASPTHLEENVRAASLELTAEDLATLNAEAA